jgi:hypothetical protein
MAVFFINSSSIWVSSYECALQICTLQILLIFPSYCWFAIHLMLRRGLKLKKILFSLLGAWLRLIKVTIMSLTSYEDATIKYQLMILMPVFDFLSSSIVWCSMCMLRSLHIQLCCPYYSSSCLYIKSCTLTLMVSYLVVWKIWFIY